MNTKSEVTGVHHGQTDFLLTAFDDLNNAMGYIKYSDFNGIPHISYIETFQNYKRQGIATELLQELQLQYPNIQIEYGMSTSDGTKLLESIIYVVENEEISEQMTALQKAKNEIEIIEKELDRLYSLSLPLSEEDTEFTIEQGDKWAELYNFIRELENDLQGKTPVKKLIKSKEQIEIEKGSISMNNTDISDFQERTIAAQELRDEARRYGLRLNINSNGTITLYHGTSIDNVNSIRQNGFNPQSYFSHLETRTGYNDEPPSYYANTKNTAGEVIEIQADARDIEFVSGTGEFYSPYKLVSDNGIWKSEERKEQFNNMPLTAQQEANTWEITNLAYNEDDYLHFSFIFSENNENYELEGLFRLYDTENGEDMKIVSIDYGYLHPIVAREWDNVEKYLQDYSKIKYDELVSIPHREEQEKNKTMPIFEPTEEQSNILHALYSALVTMAKYPNDEFLQSDMRLKLKDYAVQLDNLNVPFSIQNAVSYAGQEHSNFERYNNTVIKEAIEKVNNITRERLKNSNQTIIQHEENTKNEDTKNLMIKKEEGELIMPENEKISDNLVMGQEEKNAKDLVFDQLKQGIRDVMETEKFKNWCQSSGKMYLNNYSFNNAMLTFMQKPNSTYTMGYEAWKDFGRQVSKDARGIKILAPCFAKENEKNGLFKSIKSNLSEQLKNNPSLSYASHQLGQSKLSFTMQHNGILGLSINGREAQRFNSADDCKKFIAREVLGKVPMYFKVVTVFDVSDTVKPDYLWLKHGFNKDELALNDNGEATRNKKGEYKIVNTSERQAKFNPYIDLTLKENDVEKMETLFDVLKTISNEKGIPLTVEPIEESGVLGKFTRPQAGEQGKGNIVISDNIPPTQKVAVTIHEMAHSDLHGNLQKLQEQLGERADRNIREVQAEAVAYITAQNFGIETETKSFNYLASWSKGKELSDLEKSLDMIYRESKELMKDIKNELEKRGLSLTLEPKTQEPLTAFAKEAELKKYAAFILDKSNTYSDITKDITNDLDTVVNEDEKDIIKNQAAQVKEINSCVAEINKLALELSNSGDRATQNNIITKIDALQNRIMETEKTFDNLSEMRVNLINNTKEQETLKQQFNKNPIAVIEQLRSTTQKMLLIKPEELKYLATSKYVAKELSGFLNKNPIEFMDKAAKQYSAIENVAAKNGAFVEINSCEKWCENPIFENGTLLHPKLADKMIAEAEMQTRMLKNEAVNKGDFFPSSKCDLTVYTINSNGTLSALNTKIEIGDGEQNNLMEHMTEVCKKGTEKTVVLDNLKESVQERLNRNKIYTPEIVDDTDNRADETHNNTGENTKTIEDWKNEVNESRAVSDNNNKSEQGKTKENPDNRNNR